MFAINGGASLGLDDRTLFIAGMSFAAQLPESWSGDILVEGGKYGPISADSPYTVGGGWGIDLNAILQKTLIYGNDTIGHTTLKARPGVDLSYFTYSNKVTGGAVPDGYKEPQSPAYTSFGGFFQLGAEYKYQKIALYSGLALNLFSVRNAHYIGGHADYKSTANAWDFSGIYWNGTSLEFGLAFTPIEERNRTMTFAAKWNNAPFNLNVQTMQLNSMGSITSNQSSGLNFTTWGNIDLTVSYSY